ncbi:alpha-L-fucosidase [Paenibacillus baekrokdamisoli]|uniref:alpha-L-fucosidase n=1 Tax=Paenibacillus baekrokdamisoli TaxID=1712516 RepID=A0A3G9IZR3_9BACL|nr:alpha-L-fucosidase [Paenibacillus baekrokdamisoli]MBB3068961.1 alpha-L-fucosidase [Paenibacillus baekrokdamisoli]BBH23782.1 alpha-L-fucosidase [Paenibacillus baekrokdamisoli]
MEKMIQLAAQVTPSERQLAWQEMEFYGFIHFTVNTFTNLEWGHGDEDPAIFNPTELDANQWVEVCKSAGMKGLILTCKHHDGFCLWPSRYTDHSVKSSPWREGKGDLVREVADACRAAGIRFGIYLSPWDLHESSYGDSAVYNAFFLNQLRELLTEYGDIFCVWFDGACGEGPNGKRQVYDWKSYYQLIRELQPNAVISVCGPDVRWCGNEAGHTRTAEWSVVPAALQDNEKIQEHSQKEDDGEFAKRILSHDDDLGSREVIREAGELAWFPAEVNTSIRPGWFYHAEEDDQVKSLDELFEVYVRSVGGNATFLLNLPPDKRGLIHENDARRMSELGQAIQGNFQVDLCTGATAAASSELDDQHRVNNLFDGNPDTYWSATEGTEKTEIVIDLQEEQSFDRIILMEQIRVGQRIEGFVLEWKDGEEWNPLDQGTVVGYKRICRFDKVNARYIKLSITASRWYPTLQSFQVFLSKKV